MKTLIFQGVATALCTPFNKKGIDYYALDKMIEFQIESGVKALVVCGTTGEAPTLSDTEHKSVLAHAVKRVDRRVKVVAGTGSNDTAHAIMMTKYAAYIGADCALVVTPYYNKTNDNGLIAHYFSIADCSNIPIIIYDVPSRTGMEISRAVYEKLSAHQNLIGVKDCRTDYKKIVDTIAAVKDGFNFYAGNDGDLPIAYSLGYKGVVSVLSNVAPRQVVKTCAYFESGDFSKGRECFFKLKPLIDFLFSTVNPVPLKYALKKLKLCDNRLKAPLLPLKSSKNLDEKLFKAIKCAEEIT